MQLSVKQHLNPRSISIALKQKREQRRSYPEQGVVVDEDDLQKAGTILAVPLFDVVNKIQQLDKLVSTVNG